MATAKVAKAAGMIAKERILLARDFRISKTDSSSLKLRILSFHIMCLSSGNVGKIVEDQRDHEVQTTSRVTGQLRRDKKFDGSSDWTQKTNDENTRASNRG